MNWDLIVAALAVTLAAGWLGWRAWRTFAPQGGCGCSSARKPGCSAPR